MLIKTGNPSFEKNMVEAENCPCYKMGRLDLLQNAAHLLFQNAAIVIRKCVTYYKMICVVITKCRRTGTIDNLFECCD